MAKANAPTSLTGGEGFGYEDYVAAGFMVDMLLGSMPLGVETGCVTRLDWQGTDLGRRLDDLVVTFNASGKKRVAECSLKQAKQVSRNGFPSNFVNAAWQQWSNSDAEHFNRENDFLVLIDKAVADGTMQEWQRLLKQASSTAPKRLLSRLVEAPKQEGQQTSKIQRQIFASLSCPDNLKDGDRTNEIETVKLLSRIRLLSFDYKSKPSSDQKMAVEGCQRLLRSGDPIEAARLFDRLVFHASQLRDRGLDLDRPGLLSKLRGEFELETSIDHRSDWTKIRKSADEWSTDIRSSVGGHASLVRRDVSQKIVTCFSTHRVCLASGVSGAGKSSLVQRVGMRSFDERVVIRPEDLATGREADLSKSLSINNSFAEVLQASVGQCLVVFDSLEKATDDGIRLAGRLIAEGLSDPNSSHIAFAITVIDDSTSRVRSLLHSAGAALSQSQIVTVLLPPAGDIVKLLSGVPGLSAFRLHDDMKSLLCNLKIADWVVRASEMGNHLPSDKITGLMPLIDFLWKSWIEVGDSRYALSAVLKRLGNEEANGFATSVPVNRLDSTQQQLLSSLEESDCIRVRNERVRFAHDLLGDWARLRSLIENDPTVDDSRRSKASQSRWHRAVRLYGRWLLAETNGPERWAAAIQRTDDGTEHGTIVRDLLLESLVVSDDALSKIATCWPTLHDHEGKLLRVLLTRFLIVGTWPDYARIELVAQPDLQSQMEATMRVPNWPLWPSVLIALESQSADLVSFAPVETARLCHLWLSRVPPTVSPSQAFPGRISASRIAVAIAQSVLEKLAREEWIDSDDAQITYETLLLAGHECPELVSEVALQLANRRPPTARIKELQREARKARVQERLAMRKDGRQTELARFRRSAPFYHRGKLRAPWPDGPSDRLPHGFQEAVLSSAAMVPLAIQSCDAAVELLLAACIEEPQYEDWRGGNELGDDTGVANWDEGYPPLYFRGPFLQVMRHAPDVGIEFAIRLINFATRRYLETSFQKYRARQHREGIDVGEQPDVVVALEVAGEEKRWLGNEKIFRWHSDGFIDQKIIPCLLMAMEKWFEEQIEAGNEIEEYATRIFNGSESVAFAGLLVSVGKRRPELFREALLPILGVLEFYSWDRHIVNEDRSSRTWSIPWNFQSPEFVDLAKQWYTAEHRSVMLHRVARILLLSDQSSHSFFEACRERWRGANEADTDVSLRSFVATLDPANYQRAVDENGDSIIEYVPPVELAEEIAERQREHLEPLVLMEFPIRCRQLLENGDSLNDEVAQEVFERIKTLALHSASTNEDECMRMNSISGGICVLVNNAFTWVESEQHRLDWCLAQLEAIDQQPPPRGEMQMPRSSSNWSWESFIAECGIALLITGNQSRIIRSLTARGVVAFHYETVRRVMITAFQHRDALGDDFLQLQRLALHWSVARRCLEYNASRIANARSGIEFGFARAGDEELVATLQAEQERLASDSQALIDGFVVGDLKPTSIAEAFSKGNAAIERIERHETAMKIDEVSRENESGDASVAAASTKLHRDWLNVDTHVLSNAFAWIGSVQAWQGEMTKATVLNVCEMRDAILGSLPNPDLGDAKAEFSDRPNDFDYWVFDLVACGTSCLADEDAAAQLPIPILSLPALSGKWIERFFWSWFDVGVRVAPTPETFVRRWKPMIDSLVKREDLDSANWRNCSESEIAFGTLGLRQSNALFGDNGDYAEPLKSISSTIHQAIDKWLMHPEVAEGFFGMLIRPAYKEFLCVGTICIANKISEIQDDSFWRTRDIESRLVSVLSEVWRRHSDVVSTDQTLRIAFESLLVLLTARGNQAAASLRDRMLDTLPDD